MQELLVLALAVLGACSVEAVAVLVELCESIVPLLLLPSGTTTSSVHSTVAFPTSKPCVCDSAESGKMS